MANRLVKLTNLFDDRGHRVFGAGWLILHDSGEVTWQPAEPVEPRAASGSFISLPPPEPIPMFVQEKRDADLEAKRRQVIPIRGRP